MNTFTTPFPCRFCFANVKVSFLYIFSLGLQSISVSAKHFTCGEGKAYDLYMYVEIELSFLDPPKTLTVV